jgi:hypothetical protein
MQNRNFMHTCIGWTPFHCLVQMWFLAIDHDSLWKSSVIISIPSRGALQLLTGKARILPHLLRLSLNTPEYLRSLTTRKITKAAICGNCHYLRNENRLKSKTRYERTKGRLSVLYHLNLFAEISTLLTICCVPNRPYSDRGRLSSRTSKAHRSAMRSAFVRRGLFQQSGRSANFVESSGTEGILERQHYHWARLHIHLSQPDRWKVRSSMSSDDRCSKLVLQIGQGLREMSQSRLMLSLSNLDSIETEALRNLKDNNYCSAKALCTKLGTVSYARRPELGRRYIPWRWFGIAYHPTPSSRQSLRMTSITPSLCSSCVDPPQLSTGQTGPLRGTFSWRTKSSVSAVWFWSTKGDFEGETNQGKGFLKRRSIHHNHGVFNTNNMILRTALNQTGVRK